MTGLRSPGWVASHLFVAATVVTMIALGLWQLDRLDQRRASNDAIRAAMAREPVDLSQHAALGDGGDGDGGDGGGAAGSLPDYSAVTAAGRYLEGSEVRIANRSYLGQPGAWLATPLELVDGRVTVVVRGWIPRLNVAGVDTRPTAPPAGAVTVAGLAFASVSGGRVGETGADDTPELSRLDLDLVSGVTGLDVGDVWVRLVAQDPPPGELPVPVPAAALTDGPHLSYAFQWFFFSAGAVVVYAMILRRARGSTRADLSRPLES